MVKGSKMEITDLCYLCSRFPQGSTARAFSQHLAGAGRLVWYHT